MEYLRTQLARLQEQLAALNTTQRTLAGALVVIMLMTLAWWGNYAGNSEMTPLIDKSISGDDLAVITSRLQGKGIAYRTSGDRILVPTERKFEALADLWYSQILPRETRNAFDEAISRSTVFASSVQQQQLWLNAMQSMLAETFSYMEGVREARVFIDPKRERGFGNGYEPSASVFLKMAAGRKPDAKLVEAVADLVSGAVANLPRHRVRVVVDGASYPVRNRDENPIAAAGEEHLAQVQRAERYFCEKIMGVLSSIENVSVAVNVKLNNERTQKTVTTPDAKNSVSKPLKEESSTEETASTQGAGSDAGLVPNAPLNAGVAGGGDNSRNNTETSKTEYKVEIGRTEITSVSPGGDFQVTGCYVRVPRGYFSRAMKLLSNSEKDPDPAALDAFIQTQLATYRTGIAKCLNLTGPDDVHVEAYVDAMPVAIAAAQAGAAPVTAMLTGHVKEIALGVLALVSLFMVSNLARKSSPSPARVSAPEPPPGPLPSGEQAVGEAIETPPALDGMELDEDSAVAQQMLSQVQTMVGQNPDIAANLVKRWLNRS